MGRILGRRPDRTTAIARAVEGRLEVGERVIAGVDVQSPGTIGAGIAGGAGGAVAGALDTGPTVSRGGSAPHDRWMREATAIDIDGRAASRAVWMIMVLTTRRLVLIRRSRLTRRPREILAAWHLDDVDALRVPRGGSSITIAVGGVSLRLELPTAHRFLPDVYRELPRLFEEARGHDAGAPAG